ncbi:MAG TPA: glycosyltransferase [Candidatus Limnocylindrales bacterium]|nr:glycosyltransferase [Candidatus Limnocylindrales bacterium]
MTDRPADDTPVPADVHARAEARAEARAARDFATADLLKAEIEAEGWQVVDRGIDFDLRPARAPDVVEGGRTRHGASATVPSRLDEPPTAAASVVLVATDHPDDLARALRGLRAHAPEGTEVVVVANAPSEGLAAALDDPSGPATAPLGREPVEQIWTSARLGHAAALDAGIRRARGSIVVLLDTGLEPTGDIVGPLVDVLRDPTVAVAGPWGFRTPDLREFIAAPPGEVDVVGGYCLAFRRADYSARGPFDERFVVFHRLDVWWSLVLRDEGEGAPPRRALTIELPLVRHEHRAWEDLPAPERERLGRRNAYRVLDRFGWRRDLLLEPAEGDWRARRRARARAGGVTQRR